MPPVIHGTATRGTPSSSCTASLGPSLVGTVTQQAGDNLQTGILAGSIFPLVLIIALVLLGRKTKKS